MIKKASDVSGGDTRHHKLLRWLWVVLGVIILWGGSAAGAPKSSVITEATLRGHLEFLASVELQGRKALETGSRIAAKYVASEFRCYGLQFGGGDGYYQSVPVELFEYQQERSFVVLKFGGEVVSVDTLWGGRDIFLFPRSKVKSVSGEVVECGYGIQAPEAGYDDFKGVEVAGKFVLASMGEPVSSDTSNFFGKGKPTRYGMVAVKAKLVEKLGAVGLILTTEVSDRESVWLPAVERRKEDIEPEIIQSVGDAEFPVIYLDPNWASKCFELCQVGTPDTTRGCVGWGHSTPQGNVSGEDTRHHKEFKEDPPSFPPYNSRGEDSTGKMPVGQYNPPFGSPPGTGGEVKGNPPLVPPYSSRREGEATPPLIPPRVAGGKLEEAPPWSRGEEEDLTKQVPPKKVEFYLTPAFSETVQDTLVNVIGRLEGGKSQGEQGTVILGAHYDHLGMKDGQIYYGADDNASGVSALLALAESLVPMQAQLRGTVLFIAFGAEEEGLIGSKYYVEHPVVPLEQTVAMINMDCIGREGSSNYRGMMGGAQTQEERNLLLAFYSADYPGLEDVVKKVPNPGELTIKYEPLYGRFGMGDHYPFLMQDIPVLFFFSGYNSDYHTPNDRIEKIVFPKYTRIVNLIYEVVLEVGKKPNKLRIKN